MHSDRCVLMIPFCDMGAEQPAMCTQSLEGEEEEVEQQPPHPPKIT